MKAIVNLFFVVLTVGLVGCGTLPSSKIVIQNRTPYQGNVLADGVQILNGSFGTGIKPIELSHNWDRYNPGKALSVELYRTDITGEKVVVLLDTKILQNYYNSTTTYVWDLSVDSGGRIGSQITQTTSYNNGSYGYFNMGSSSYGGYYGGGSYYSGYTTTYYLGNRGGGYRGGGGNWGSHNAPVQSWKR